MSPATFYTQHCAFDTAITTSQNIITVIKQHSTRSTVTLRSQRDRISSLSPATFYTQHSDTAITTSQNIIAVTSNILHAAQ